MNWSELIEYCDYDKHQLIDEFQGQFSRYCERKFCIATINGTSALHLVLKSLGVSEGDEVIVNDLTFIASAAPIVWLGATPIFAEVDYKNWCLDTSRLKDYITPKTKGIISVNLYGNTPNYKEIREICDKYNLFLVEDFAQSLGSNNSGSYGDASITSFQNSKLLSCGEGGAIVTDDNNLATKCFYYRNHCKDTTQPGYFNKEIGFKYVPSNLLMGLLNYSLQNIDKTIERKKEIFSIYTNHLLSSFININQQNSCPWKVCINWHNNYQIDASKLEQKLNPEIPVKKFFYPLSSLPAFPGSKIKYEQFNINAYGLHNKAVSLPSEPSLTNEQIENYAVKILAALKETQNVY